MNTTNLFVELIVIGVGAGFWVFLLLAGLLDLSVDHLADAIKAETAVPLLAVIYVLGIVTDRIADTIFEKLWGDSLRQKKFGDLANYYRDRRTILTKSQPLSDLLEYGRSRLRICRGWCLNSVLIALTFNLFLSLNSKMGSTTQYARLLGTSIFLFLAGGAWYSWRKLTESEYRKVKEQSQYLASEDRNEKRMESLNHHID